MVEMLIIGVYMENESEVEEFIREYALDAVDRLPQTEFCEQASFYPAHKEGEPVGKRTGVLLHYHGNADDIIQQEGSHLDDYVDSGLVREWEEMSRTPKAEKIEEWGAQTAELGDRLNSVEAQISKSLYEEFDDFPAAIDEFPDNGKPPIGWWGVLHSITVQLNYSLQEELDAYIQGIDHTLRNFATYASPEEAEARLDDTIERLEAKREAVKEGRHDS